MIESQQGWLIVAAAEEPRVPLRADEFATQGVGSSPGEAGCVSWTCHHRIRNRRRDLPWYTVGKRALSHRISDQMEE